MEEIVQKLLVAMEPELMETLRSRAAEEGVPMAEIVRRALSEYFRRTDDRWERALRIVGKYASGASDVSEQHDRYLEEAYAE